MSHFTQLPSPLALRRIVIGAALAASSWAALAYQGLAIGQGKLAIDCTGTSSCDQASLGGKYFFGAPFSSPSPGLSLGWEGGLVYWGKATATWPPTPSGANTLSSKAAGLALDLTVTYLFGAGQCQGNVGYAYNRARTERVVDGAGSSSSHNRSAPHLGFSCTMAFFPNNLWVGYDKSKVTYLPQQSADVHLVWLGFRF